uniref:Inositol polyphosphate-related phosphatase domain-containing protein n=1 Tax=Lygus hesperus TaxID=30085 RepID=A0A0K8SAD3_LYGHE
MLMKYYRLRLHVATWNVNGQNPPDNLYKLLGQRNPTTPEPDVVVLGLQEVTITPQFLYSDKWSKQVDDILSSSYTKVGTEAMVGVIMNIYIKKDHQWALGQVEVRRLKLDSEVCTATKVQFSLVSACTRSDSLSSIVISQLMTTV